MEIKISLWNSKECEFITFIINAVCREYLIYYHEILWLIVTSNE